MVRLHAPPVYGALDARPSDDNEEEGGEMGPRGSRRLATFGWVGLVYVYVFDERVCVPSVLV